MLNYYEMLEVSPDTSQATIQQKINEFRATMEARLGDPLQMQAARCTLNDILPKMEQSLLNPQERAKYDQDLLKSTRQAGHEELADDEGLDDELSHLFFFDPFDGYDTEEPAHTLREIGIKLDTDWATAIKWIKNTSNDIHVLVGYLTFAADRHQLASRIEKIIEAVSDEEKPAMNVNEGIERCIEIFHPDIERPKIGFHGPFFDGRAYTFHMGEFIPGNTALFEFVLFHNGMRGCTFGTIETSVPWVRLPDGTTSTRFALMPEGTEPAIGITEKTFKFCFHMEQLKPYADYTTDIVVNLENFNPPIEIPLYVSFHIQARPPLVVFEPNVPAPLSVGTHKRGEIINLRVLAKNAGDEEHIPLAAYIAAPDPATRVMPTRFQHNETITLSIDTSKFPTGERFLATFPIDYSSIPGASGPPAILVEGYTYPTVWQSLVRQRDLGTRTTIGVITALIGSILLVILMANVAGNSTSWWLFIVSVPALCTVIALLATSIISKHAKATQNNTILQKMLSPLWHWQIACAYGLLVAILCSLLPDTPFAFWISGLTGGIAGFLGGFIVDDRV